MHHMALVAYHFGWISGAMHSETVIKVLQVGPGKPAGKQHECTTQPRPVFYDAEIYDQHWY